MRPRMTYRYGQEGVLRVRQIRLLYPVSTYYAKTNAETDGGASKPNLLLVVEIDRRLQKWA